LTSDGSKFIQNFQQVVFEQPAKDDRSATVRYSRRVLAYRALLAKAGFDVPSSLKATTTGLFSKELIAALEQSTSDERISYVSSAVAFAKPNPKWSELASAFESL
jgi:hypothetical protein